MIDTLPDAPTRDDLDTLDEDVPARLKSAATDEELGIEGQRLRARLRAKMFGVDAAPLKIGRYTVLDTLGSGGMGVVYAAYDEALDRRVAVKLLQRDPDTERSPGNDRLLREAQALARLSHPNVVQVYEVGTFDGRVFIAMEFLPGPTLRKWKTTHAPKWPEILAKYIQAGEGLAAAHAHGVIHRDVKPANLLLGADGRVRVVDFGLARGIEPELATPVSAPPSALDVAITQTGDVMGTPAYMSPEQIKMRPVDARSDQFSFCVALYEALFGVRPFAGESATDVMLAIVEGQLREPPRGHGVPPRIVRALQRGLSVPPADRFVDMRSLLDHLRDPTASRRRWAWGVGAGALAILVWLAVRGRGAEIGCPDFDDDLAGVWNDASGRVVTDAFAATGRPYATTVAANATSRLDRWAAAWAAGRKEVCEASRVRSEQSDELHDVRVACLLRQRDAVGRMVEQFERADAEVVDHAWQGLAELPEASACVTAPAVGAAVAKVTPARARVQSWVDEGQALLFAGRSDSAERSAGRAIEEATALDAPDLLADAYLLRGRARAKREGYAEAVEDFTTAIDLAEANRLDARAAMGWIRRAKIHAWIDDADAAQADARRARASVQRLDEPGIVGEELAIVLGDVAVAAGQGDDALTHYAQAQSLRQARVGAEDFSMVEILIGIGRAQELRGDLVATIAAYEQVERLRGRLFGEGHPLVGHDQYRLGQAHFSAGAPARARPYLEAAAATYESLGGPLVVWAVRTHELLTLVGRQLGDDAMSLDHARKAARLAADRPAGDVERITAVSLYAEELSMQGRWKDAEMQWRELAEVSPTGLDSQAAAAVVLAGVNVGMADHERGEEASALQWIERGRARALLIEDPDMRAHTVASSLQGLARVQLALGRAEASAESAAEGLAALGDRPIDELRARLWQARADALEAIDASDPRVAELRRDARAKIEALGGVWTERLDPDDAGSG